MICNFAEIHARGGGGLLGYEADVSVNYSPTIPKKQLREHRIELYNKPQTTEKHCGLGLIIR